MRFARWMLFNSPQRDEIEQGDTLLFIASDHRLLEAAQAENLTTWNPADTAEQPAPVN